jgi:hypothetical protein
VDENTFYILAYIKLFLNIDYKDIYLSINSDGVRISKFGIINSAKSLSPVIKTSTLAATAEAIIGKSCGSLIQGTPVKSTGVGKYSKDISDINISKAYR